MPRDQAMTYDRGAKILGIIESQIGEQDFLDFMKLVYCKYQFRILRVADFQRELEAYTGRPWGEFFQTWLYSVGAADWAVEDVTTRTKTEVPRTKSRSVKGGVHGADTLGIRFTKDGPYDLRIPHRAGGVGGQRRSAGPGRNRLDGKSVTVTLCCPSRRHRSAWTPTKSCSTRSHQQPLAVGSSSRGG